MRCPSCNKKITYVLEFQTASVPYKLNIENGEYGELVVEDIDAGDVECRVCPECRAIIQVEIGNEHASPLPDAEVGI